MLGIDQKTLAGMAGVSVPTVQRMEASQGNVRGIIESLTRIIEALDRAGIELISEGMRSNAGGRGVRLKSVAEAVQVTPRPANDGAGDVGG